MSDHPRLTRRRALTGGLLTSAGFLAAAAPAPSFGAPASFGAPSPSARPSRVPPGRTIDLDGPLGQLEQRHAARVGVYAANLATGARVIHRADERFAFCSVYKAPLVAHVLHSHAGDPAYLNRVIRYSKHDLIAGDFVTGLYLDSGMTVRGLCAAALNESDNVAANLLLGLSGGPRGLTAFLRSIGDEVTDVVHGEPAVNAAIPGEREDTTTPRAIAADFRELLLGRVLSEGDRTQLRLWMENDMVNLTRFRAAVPEDWQIADKTGTGDYASTNDVGVMWTRTGTPLSVAVLTTKPTGSSGAPGDDALVAAVTRIVARSLGA